MSKTVCFITLLIVIAFCVSKSSNIEGLLSKMVELNNKVKGDDNSRVDVNVIAARLNANADEMNSSFETHFAKILNSLQAGTNNLGDFAKKLADSRLEIQARIDEAKAKGEEAKENRKRLAESLGNRRKDLLAKEEEIKKLLEDYTEQRIESEEKATILRQLKNIIEDELLNDQPAPHAFIQLKRNFNVKLAHLKKLLQKSKADFNITPILSSLIQIAGNGNFSDQGTLKQIINLIDKLSANINEFLHTLETNMETNSQLLKNQEDQIHAEVLTTASLVAQASSDIKELNARKEHAQATLAAVDNRASRVDTLKRYWASKVNTVQQFSKHNEEQITAFRATTQQIVGAVGAGHS